MTSIVTRCEATVGGSRIVAFRPPTLTGFDSYLTQAARVFQRAADVLILRELLKSPDARRADQVPEDTQ